MAIIAQNSISFEPFEIGRSSFTHYFNLNRQFDSYNILYIHIVGIVIGAKFFDQDVSQTTVMTKIS